MDRKELISWIDTVQTVIIAAALFFLPLVFLTGATDPFTIPKQLLILLSTGVLLLVWGAKIILERKIIVVVSPLNLPLAAFGAVLFISSILSANRFDSIQQSIPAVAAIVFCFIIINTIRSQSSFSTVLSAYILGAAASALITVAYFFKIYFLPFAVTQNQAFNTSGSIIQQLIYLIPVFIFSAVYIGRKLNFPKIRLSAGAVSDYGFYIQLIALLALTSGIAVIVYQIIALPNKPILLPYIYGFQIAFAAISQDASRFVQALLFGSGYGTFLIDFTRFKLPSFNLEQNIWNLSFSFSSSFFLELIATTGVLGALSYIGVIFAFIRTRIASNPIFVSLFVAFALSGVLPFSYLSVAGLLALVGIYVVYLHLEEDKRIYDVSLTLITFKRGIPTFEATPEGEHSARIRESVFFPMGVFLTIAALVGFTGYYTFKFAVSDFDFAQSLRAAQANQGQKTYELQTSAIKNFPYRSDYQRIFSQVNLALANSLAASIAPGGSPSAQVQQNITALLQQSINSARNAVVLSPRTSLNWQNLAIVYRSLIRVGQNADQFSISSMNQAIALDPYNPNLYIVLGGIYYQLERWDEAASQFQVAINLKRDFANGYYNLGHAYESKGDLERALAAYQTVRQLSAGNRENLEKIDAEIKVLQARIGSEGKAAADVAPQTEQPPLSISNPQTTLPERKPPIKISPPPGEATPSAR